MRGIKSIVFAVAIAGMFVAATAPKSEAQVTVNIGVAPDCPYGYSGATPKVGDKPAAQRRTPEQFKGNEDRDGRGHTAGQNR